MMQCKVAQVTRYKSLSCSTSMLCGLAIRLTNCAAESRTKCTCCNHGNTCTVATNHSAALISRAKSRPLSASGTADLSRGRTLIFGGHLAEKEDRVSCNVEMYCYVHAVTNVPTELRSCPGRPRLHWLSVLFCAKILVLFLAEPIGYFTRNVSSANDPESEKKILCFLKIAGWFYHMTWLVCFFLTWCFCENEKATKRFGCPL
jgi:hypothetical protein